MALSTKVSLRLASVNPGAGQFQLQLNIMSETSNYRCPNCKFPVAEGAQACGRCGADFGAGSAWKPQTVEGNSLLEDRPARTKKSRWFFFVYVLLATLSVLGAVAGGNDNGHAGAWFAGLVGVPLSLPWLLLIGVMIDPKGNVTPLMLGLSCLINAVLLGWFTFRRRKTAHLEQTNLHRPEKNTAS